MRLTGDKFSMLFESRELDCHFLSNSDRLKRDGEEADRCDSGSHQFSFVGPFVRKNAGNKAHLHCCRAKSIKGVRSTFSGRRFLSELTSFFQTGSIPGYPLPRAAPFNA